MKKRNVTKIVTNEEVPVPVPVPADVPPQCGAWCFILGAATGAFCGLELGHDGDHRVQINVLAEPQSRFAIYWQLGGPEEVQV